MEKPDVLAGIDVHKVSRAEKPPHGDIFSPRFLQTIQTSDLSKILRIETT
jgi:hypothetical protein